MSPIFDRLRTIPTRYLAVLAILLFFPAHLIHLGTAAFNGDEGIRSLVALEMHLSGNYVAPTMHGAPYINKPPLFNWILLVFFKLFGYFGEYPARMATVFFLAGYAAVIYRFTRKEFGAEFSFLTAFMVILSGRFLIYDSMLGLIDTTFSVVIYSLFMSIWHFGVREQWWRLFIVSYVLMATGFLLKGLPAIVFQGLSLTAGLVFFGQWRRLFSLQHVAGILLAGGIIGAWLLAYFQYQPLEKLLPNLVEESVKRTAVVFGWWRTIEHVFRFPFDAVYHFLPYSLLILAWFSRQFWQRLRQHRFVFFNFILLAVNLPVYWSSVQVYPRYLLMFIPLFTVLSFYLMEQERAVISWRYRLFYGALGVLAVLLPLAFGAMPLVKSVNFLPHIWPLSMGCGLVLALAAGGYFMDKRRYLWWSVIGLLLGRIAFDLIILPTRHHENDTSLARRDALALVEKYRDRNWYVFGKSYVREPAAFYMTNALGRIVQRTADTGHPNALYLVNPNEVPFAELYLQGNAVDTLKTDYWDVTLLVYLRN